MKKLAVLIFALASLVSAQTTTPNLNLTLPNFGNPNWNIPLNNDLSLIDGAIGLLQVPFQGAWASTAVYSRGEQVSFNGAIYTSLINSNFGNTPNVATSAWQLDPSSGAGSVTWPATADIVVSNGTNAPNGLTPVNGDCVVGSSGTWIAGPCSTGSNGFPITLGTTEIAAGSTTTSVAGLEVNGVMLNSSGSASLFLNQAGAYATPAASGSISVDGSTVSNPNLNETTPAAPSGSTNCTWAVSGSNVSCSIPNGDSSGSSFFQVLANDPSVGTSTGLLACYTGAGSGGDIGTCPTSVGASQGTDNFASLPIAGVCVSGCGTTGSATVQYAGNVSWICDSAITVPGDFLQPSSSVAGECHQPVSIENPRPNENPEGNTILGLPTSANTGAGTAAIVNMLPFPYYTAGNVVLSAGPGSPFLTVAHMSQEPSTYAIPFALGLNGVSFPQKTPENPAPGNATNFGSSTLGTSGMDTVLDTLTHGFGGPVTTMLALPGSQYQLPAGVVSGILTPPSISDTWAVGIAGFFCVGNSSGMFIVRLAGNTTQGPAQPNVTSNSSCDNAGHVIYFEILPPSSGGPFALTWASNFVNAPIVSLSSGASPVLASFLFDGAHYNCLSGCASSSGSGVSSVNGISAAVTIVGDSSITVTPNSPATGDIQLHATGVSAGVAEIIPGSGTNCTPLVSGSCTGNVTINSTGTGSGGPTGWMVEDFISQSENIFSLAFSENASSLAWTGGILGHNGINTATASGSNNEFGVFGLPFTNGTAPFVVGSGASFAVASLLEGTGDASGPLIFGYGDTPGNEGQGGLGGGGPNPPNEVSFHCDSLGLGNNDWFTFLSVNGSAVTSDTGISCLSWHTLEISDSGATATFFIDGASVGTQTMPTTAYTAFFAVWSKPGGTGNAVLAIDWFGERVDQTSFNSLK